MKEQMHIHESLLAAIPLSWTLSPSRQCVSLQLLLSQVSWLVNMTQML